MFQIEDVPLFSKFNTEQIDILKSNLMIKSHKNKSILFYEGDKSEYLYILLDGQVRLYKTTNKGIQKEIHRFYAPILIAEYAFLERIPFPATCEFVTDATVGMLHYDQFYKYLSDQQFALGFIRSLTNKFNFLSNYVHRESILSSTSKVADFILLNHELFSKLKNNEIAKILNLTPETFSRVISKFKKDGFISIEGQDIVILAPSKLESLIATN